MPGDDSLLVRDAAEVFTVGETGPDVIEDGALAIDGGEVLDVGPTVDLLERHDPEAFSTTVDATGRAVLPGFVDPHTHALFAGDRSDEFAAKLRGKTYQEILEAGGGILRTVRAVREADFDELLGILLDHLDTMVAHGTTTVEVKSGYGLDTETELKMLEVAAAADEAHPVDVVPTFLGAHAVPDGVNRTDYVDSVVEEQLPAVAEQGIAAYVDVFCDEGAFTLDEARRILEAGAGHGLGVKIHAEEFARLGGAQLAATLDGTSADHLLQANPEDAAALADAGVIPVLLPGTAFSLGTEYADPGMFADAGADVALATDFNPNCHSQSMPFAVTLACVGMGMTPADALVAATRNAALAVDRTNGLGTLRPGSPADAVILDAPSHVHVPYRFAMNTVESVIKNGRVVRGPDG